MGAPYSAARSLRGVALLVALFFAVAASVAADKDILYEQKLNPYPLPILVPATIGGKKCDFIFDTGATVHFFDTTFKALLGPVIENKPMQTIGGRTDMEFFVSPHISLGGWHLPDSKAVALDCQAFRTITGSNIRGIIGVSALKRTVVSFDFEHRSLRILRNLTPSSNMKVLDFDFDPTGVPCLKLEIEGEPLEMTIDSGDNGYIGLRHETFVKMATNGMIELSRRPDSPSETARGSLTEVSGTFARGWLLGMNLKGLPVHDSNTVTNLGVGFLLNFDFVIDFQGRRFLYKHRETLPPIKHNLMLGCALMYSEARKHVYRLNPEGAAAAAGLREGDEIIRLGPINKANLNDVSIYELCLQHAGERLGVEFVRPGEPRHFVTNLNLPTRQFVYALREFQ